MTSVIDAECLEQAHYAKGYYAEYLYTERHYGECHGAP